jgi:localization factor PodJL
VLYARGLGVEQNFAESFRWFALAASQGDREAASRRDDVAKRVDAQSLAAIRKAVQTWSPRPVDESANEARLKPEWGTSELQPERRRAVKK